MGHKVELYIYDLSGGMAKSLLPMLGLNIDLEGVWHTAIVVHGLEWFYGSSGIEHCHPGGTLLGQPLKVEQLGETNIDQDTLKDYLGGLRNDRYHGRRYDLFKHNCNNFSNEIATFLCNKTIPRYILDLPNQVLSSPLAQLIKPMLEQALPHGSTFDEDLVSQTQPQASNTNSSDSNTVKKADTSATDYVKFDSTISSERVVTKLKELNEMGPEKINQDSLYQIRHQIEQPQEFNVKIWSEVFKPTLHNWNLENIFPLLDVIRYCSSKSPLPEVVSVESFQLIKSRDMISPSSPESVVRMVLRLLSNFFLFETSRSFFRSHAEEVINMLQTIIGDFSSGKDMLEIAASSVALNLAISLKTNHEQEVSILLTSALICNFVPEVKNFEALLRVLTALRILIEVSEETKDFAMALDLKQVLEKVPKFDSKIEDCIKTLTKSL